tara:strand:+ start:234 stop:749 length:516 start_codon:yes stop_codon:yes gene_type:complete
MAWTTDLLLFVRTLIGDLDSSKYTDARLEQIIVVGAYNVNDATDFDYTYTVDIAAKTISPDPVDNKDTDFTVLTAYKSACIIVGSEVKTEAANSLSLRDGPSAIDLRGVATTLNALYKDLCQKYEELLDAYKAGNRIYGQAILGPYSPGSAIVNTQFQYGYSRSGTVFENQ